MEDRKYESGSIRRQRSGPGRGMGRMGGGEKPKDLVGIWKKLLGYCKKYCIIFLVPSGCKPCRLLHGLHPDGTG